VCVCVYACENPAIPGEFFIFTGPSAGEWGSASDRRGGGGFASRRISGWGRFAGRFSRARFLPTCAEDCERGCRDESLGSSAQKRGFLFKSKERGRGKRDGCKSRRMRTADGELRKCNRDCFREEAREERRCLGRVSRAR